MTGPFRGQIIPKVGFAIVAPDFLVESKTLRRIHNKVSKEAGEAVMLIHWRQFMPEHFKQTNRGRYAHEPRGRKYKRQKKQRYGSITDLVKTGRTRDYMLTLIPRIQIGGKAENIMIVHMHLKWPFPAGKAGKAKVTREQMNKELETWIQAEEQYILEQFQKLYGEGLRRETSRRPRIRSRLAGHGVMFA